MAARLKKMFLNGTDPSKNSLLVTKVSSSEKNNDEVCIQWRSIEVEELKRRVSKAYFAK